ncbi:MAG: type II toxin-antitoxin system HicA family toxin [Bacteroidia bacterium]|nr:type II toxin-antitoxin system HicA family toxin [Bacteroidia bacterium]
MKSISGKKFCKLIENKGWVLKRINGSHHIYGKPGTDILLVIPVHKNDDLKTGLLKSLMKLSGIEENAL